MRNMSHLGSFLPFFLSILWSLCEDSDFHCNMYQVVSPTDYVVFALWHDTFTTSSDAHHNISPSIEITYLGFNITFNIVLYCKEPIIGKQLSTFPHIVQGLSGRP